MMACPLEGSPHWKACYTQVWSGQQLIQWRAIYAVQSVGNIELLRKVAARPVTGAVLLSIPVPGKVLLDQRQQIAFYEASTWYYNSNNSIPQQ